MKKERWLWPTSHSLFLQHELYRDVDLYGSKAYGDEVLAAGSDDELDQEQRRTKRRRINGLAREFLANRGLMIPSACLRGPFGESDDDNYPPSDAGMLSEPEEIVEQDDNVYHLETIAPAVMPAVLHADASSQPVHMATPLARTQESRKKEILQAGMQSSCRKPPSASPSARQDLLAVAEEVRHDAVMENELSEPPPSILDGIMNAKSLSFSAINVSSDDLAGIKEAKRLSHAAIELGNSSHTVSTRSPGMLNRDASLLDDPKAALPATKIVTKKRVPDASSPFLFRYKKARDSHDRTTTPPATAVELTAQSPPPRTHDIFDVSFDDDSEFLERHTNKRLRRLGPCDSGRKALKGKLRKAMRDSGATFEYDAGAPPTPDRRSSAVKALEQSDDPSTPSDATPSIQKSGVLHQIIADRNAVANVQEVPAFQISTQAALQEAHRDLLKSSPNNDLLSPNLADRRPTTAETSQSPPPAVTPFAKFHQRFHVNEHDTQEPLISTQAIFDAFSPFQISPAKQSARDLPDQSPANTSGFIAAPSFLPINGSDKQVRDSRVQIDSEQRGPAKVDQSRGNIPVIDAGWSFAALDASPHTENPKEQAKSAGPIIQPHPTQGLKSMGFRVTKASSQSRSNGPTQPDGSQTKQRSQSMEQEHLKGEIGLATTVSQNKSEIGIDGSPTEEGHSHDASQTRNSAKDARRQRPAQPSFTNPQSTSPSLSRPKKMKKRRRKSLPANGTQSNRSELPPPLSQPTLSRHALNKSDINRSFVPSRPQSFSLSNIIADLTSSHPYVDFRNVLSQTSVNSLNAGRHSLPLHKRSSAIDWDAGSDRGDTIPPREDGIIEQLEPSNISRIVDSMAVTDQRPPMSSTDSFTRPSFPAPRVRPSLDSQSPSKIALSLVSEQSFAVNRSSRKGSLKSSLKKTSKESIQDAQKETMLDMDTEFDIDASLNDLKDDVLGGWDVEEEARAL